MQVNIVMGGRENNVETSTSNGYLYGALFIMALLAVAHRRRDRVQQTSE